MAASVVMVVADRLGVDQDAVDLGRLELELVLQPGDHLVDALHFERVGQGAVAGDMDPVTDPSDDDVVNVEDLGEVSGRAAQLRLDEPVALQAHG